jgi:competence protein ComEA
MKGCLDYTKEASTRRLRLPHLSVRSRIGLIVFFGLTLFALAWFLWPGDDAQGFELIDATADDREETGNAADTNPAAPQQEQAAESASPPTTLADGVPLSDAPVERIVVYVSGAVIAPGVYELRLGARIDDGVRAAGGLREDAAGASVNLAALLEDGMQVHIPTIEELASGSVQAPASSFANGAADTNAQSGPVNINTADSATLESLPGIGPATAQRIIAYREANGPFSSIEGLKQVSGIGEKKYAALADLICV